MSLLFCSCEKDREVIDCSVSINSESITSSYTAASVVCDFHSYSTFENVYIQYADNSSFTNYHEELMEKISDKYVVGLSYLEPNTTYYLRYIFKNRYSSFSPIKKGHLTTTASPSIPIVITDSASEVSFTSATIGGNIISNGESEIKECGIVYGLSSAPTIDNLKIPIKNVTSKYTLSLNNLDDGAMYYVRSYAINNNGISYGQEISFTTQAYSLPNVKTTAASDITYTSVNVGGEIISAGGLEIKECGIVYSTHANPTTHDIIIKVPTNTDTFSVELTNLIQGTTYYFRAYAINEKGIGYGEQVMLTTLEKANENGYEYVDLGLSVKWATHNIGATTPEEFGDYFAWGEIETKEWFDWYNYKWSEGTYLTKYCTDNLYSYWTTDHKKVLEPADDAATMMWGSEWRMPSKKELEELLEQCIWTSSSVNGVEGYKVTSKKAGYTNKSIFLPAAGEMTGSPYKSQGVYLSRTLYKEYPESAYALYWYPGKLAVGAQTRSLGSSIRPVFK